MGCSAAPSCGPPASTPGRSIGCCAPGADPRAARGLPPGRRTISPPSPEADLALRARAAAPELSADTVFGRTTAAALLGLPLWGLPLDRLHVIRDRSSGGRLRRGMHVHCVRLPPEDVLDLGGVRVTTPARTVVDLARSVPPEQALVTVDGALHRAVVRARRAVPDPGAVTPGELGTVVARLPSARGAPAARRVVGLADPLSESPGESRSRFRMHLAGLPAPVTRWPVPGTRYRVDFAWPDRGLVGEFDGRVKYGRALRPGMEVGEVLWREKRREDRIRAAGWTVVRWVWAEIGSPGPDGMVAGLRRRPAQ